MPRKLRKIAHHMAAAVLDRWLRRMTPGERVYVLEELNNEIFNRLVQAGLADLRPGALRGHLHVLKEFYVREAEKLTRAEQVNFFRTAAVRLGVESYAASGPAGTFHGSSHDEVVLARYAVYGTWDPTYQMLLREHLFSAARGTLIDVGANIGLTCIPVARERGITCYAFEPEPRTFMYLRQNVLANAVESRVNCFNLALFSEEGSLTLRLASRNLGDHRVQSGSFSGETEAESTAGEGSGETIAVKATTLDAFFRGKSLDPPVVIKNDTQGSEVHVLRGAAELLSRVDYLITEFDPYLLGRMGDSVDAYVERIALFPYGVLLESPDNLSGGTSDLPKRFDRIDRVIERMKAISRDSSASDRYANVILARHPEFAAA